MVEILSIRFHLCHNRTGKSVKVPIFLLALDAAVASYMTAWATFKFTSFLGWMLTVRTNTVYPVLTFVTINVCLGQKSKRTARSCNKSGSTAWAGVGLSEDSRSLSLPQTRLVFSSSFTHTESCWSSGEGESGFPANFFSRKRACLLLERANAEGEFLFFRRRLTGFTVARPATSLSSLALFGVLAGSLQLTVNDNESWFRVSFHEYRLSSSFSSLFRTSMIDFGIILGRASIIIFQKSRWQEFSVHSIRHCIQYSVVDLKLKQLKLLNF